MKYCLILLFLINCSSTPSRFHEQAKLEGLKSINFNWIRSFDPKHIVGNQPINQLGVASNSDTLFVPKRKKMIALNSSTLSQIWEVNEEVEIASTPALWNENIFYTLSDGSFVSRKTIDGSLNYSTPLGVGKAKPVVAGSYAALSLSNNSIVLIDLEKGEVVWNYQRTNSSKSSLSSIAEPVFYDGNIFAGFSDGFLVSLKASNGEVNWESRLSIGDRFIEITPAINLIDGNIITGTQESPLAIIDPSNGKIIKRLGYVLSTPIVELDEYLYFGDNKGQIIKLDKGFKVISYKKLFKTSLADLSILNEELVGVDQSNQVLKLDSNLNRKSIFQLGTDHSTAYSSMLRDGENLLLYSTRYRLYSIK